MLDRRSPIDALADLPACDALQEARGEYQRCQAHEETALEKFRVECQRVNDAGRWVQNDQAARAAEAALIGAGAARRIASAKVEKIKREVAAPRLEKHFRKRGDEAMQLLTSLVSDAAALAAQLAEISDSASADGANVPYKMQKLRGAASKLCALTEALK